MYLGRPPSISRDRRAPTLLPPPSLAHVMTMEKLTPSILSPDPIRIQDAREISNKIDRPTGWGMKLSEGGKKDSVNRENRGVFLRYLRSTTLAYVDDDGCLMGVTPRVSYANCEGGQLRLFPYIRCTHAHKGGRRVDSGIVSSRSRQLGEKVCFFPLAVTGICPYKRPSTNVRIL